MFNGVQAFMDRAGRVRPLLLTLEDLHWADEPTLLLLQHLAQRLREMPVLIVGTYRDVELDVARPLNCPVGCSRCQSVCPQNAIHFMERRDLNMLLMQLRQQRAGL